MKFNVTRTSDWDYLEQKEINSLEELMSFIKANGACVVTAAIDEESSTGKWTIPSIEIYDTWRE